MPFIHIKTLKTAKAYKAPVTAIVKDFAQATGIDISKRTRVPLDQIYREGRSGRVFDAGKVVRW